MGNALAWGEPTFGGDSSQVSEQLSQVQQIQASWRAFAAIKEDGTVATWGHPDWGGDSSQVSVQTKVNFCPFASLPFWFSFSFPF